MANLIFTGRFQPLHNGHFYMLKAIKEKYPDDLLIICIIRNSFEDAEPQIENAFYKVSRYKQQKQNNPLPNWNRYRLLQIAVGSDELLKNNTVIIFRDRSDLNWERSLQDLPEDRVFVFPEYCNEEFDREKLKYYRNKNEKIVFIPTIKQYESATNFREKLYSGCDDLSFMPEACREYFQKYCLKYFKEKV